ncbi:hypothetical protein PN36_20805 [Candidatus Thiomargarita nelsonii]|uniref:Uncharacterized protein n=1 Tax=Candidatus Thiomargarita nelsonii TaxID=1003181 RepID=A0A0A6PBU0_9GAMM|nr:hypothetical protein PN36_20805 [Candidatus Thiomargarita nelsonii]
MDQNTDLPEAESKGNHSSRPQRKIRSKTSQLKIDETIKVETKKVPEGSIFKGYQDYIVQDLIIKTHNTKYQLERWQTPDGTYIISPAPIKGHFGPTLESFIVHQYYNQHVTQPLLLEQLKELTVEISAGYQ